MTRLTPNRGIARWIATSAMATFLAACASAPRQTTCAGTRVLVVQNNTNTDVDIFAADTRGERMLGIASPGRREFSLTDIAPQARFYAKRDGSYLNVMTSNGAAGRRVEFNVACR